MSDQAMQSDNGKDEISEKGMQPYQSVWMSHWTHTSYKSVNDTRNELSLPYDSGEDSHRTKDHNLLGGLEIESGSSKFVKEFREMHKQVINENLTSSKKLRQETFKGQHFPMFKSFRKREGTLSLKNVESSYHHEGVLRSQIGPTSGCDVSLGRTDNHLPSWTPSKTETQSMESQFEHEVITSNPKQQVKSNKLLEISAPVKDEFLGSTSRTVPTEFNGSTPTESFIHWQDYTNQQSSSLLVHEKKMDNNAAPLIHDPSTSNNQLMDFVGEQLQVMPNHSNVKLFSNQTRPPQARLYHGSYEIPRTPSSFHDVETMRICTTIDSVKEFVRGPPKFSQTTHHLLITKKTDVNLSDRGQSFRESTISTEFKGKPVGKLLSLAPDCGFNVKPGVKLQALESSTESEAKENIENIHTSAVDIKNESSAETDTMDMDTLRENHLSGVASSLSDKDIKGTLKSLSQAAIASVREESRDGLPNIEIPDINQELPAIPAITSLADDDEASISRTQSLDVEHFLSHGEHLTSSKSITCADGPLGLDPCSRWVKRLRPSASCSFGHGTKSSKMGEPSSQQKVNKFITKILSCSKTSSEPKMNKSHGKEQMLIDQTAELLRNAESSCAESGMKCQDITLSHAWFQRWCHKPAVSSKKKLKDVVVCEPESSKAELFDFQKKQFPSIAAMALMGKAMTGFRPCEFRKRGSSVVWNTKGLN